MGLIIFSQVVAWPALAAGGMLYPVYGTIALKIGSAIYALTWVTLGLGVLLAGRDGLTYTKDWIRNKLSREKPPSK